MKTEYTSDFVVPLLAGITFLLFLIFCLLVQIESTLRAVK